MMLLGMWINVGWMLFVFLVGLGFLLWALRHGQFRDVESAKYRMLEDKDPEPWPDQLGDRK